LENWRSSTTAPAQPPSRPLLTPGYGRPVMGTGSLADKVNSGAVCVLITMLQVV